MPSQFNNIGKGYFANSDSQLTLLVRFIFAHSRSKYKYQFKVMVDGLPCNRFGLPEKFHASFKY